MPDWLSQVKHLTLDLRGLSSSTHSGAYLKRGSNIRCKKYENIPLTTGSYRRSHQFSTEKLLFSKSIKPVPELLFNRKGRCAPAVCVKSLTDPECTRYYENHDRYAPPFTSLQQILPEVFKKVIRVELWN